MDLLERTSLLEELADVLATGGRVVLVAGEAGIGKSALVRRFTERHSGEARFLVGACDPLLTPRALGPLHDLGRQTGGRLAGLLAAGSPREELFAALLDELDHGARAQVVTYRDDELGSTTRSGRSSAGCRRRRCGGCSWLRCPRRPWPSWPGGPAARPPGCAPSPAGTHYWSPRCWPARTPASP